MSRLAEKSDTDEATTSESSDPRRPRSSSTGCANPGGPSGMGPALANLVRTYGGDTYRLLTDVANVLETSVAYVDRLTVEAHVERPLSDTDWSAIASTFTAMAFDEHIGDAGTVRTDWIDDMLLRAGLPGRGQGNRDSSNSIGQPPRP